MNPIESVHESIDIIASATQFINSTSSHIFLTGKAGTGKTTFLKNLSSFTHKQFAIVAPTGIAALNAGGVTIHSQFLFPLGMFVPDRNATPFNSSTNFYTSDTLARSHPMNSARKQVLRSIDLLVIDEVSMLRADLLDAIDYRMKAAKGNFRQSFGGVQLLACATSPGTPSETERSLVPTCRASKPGTAAMPSTRSIASWVSIRAIRKVNASAWRMTSAAGSGRYDSCGNSPDREREPLGG
jgi:hypothetical protein